ncbi:helix-turn-helix domain-containing protein [uncultured Rhodoblastus sp.]|uniref:helix-turn-helix transcriptional regulator n=1 Tax=uncultured Rhodoblastus sp. TaxID=543037 RepID=UPI0025CC494C|nr:helix-turn-helix domain-containing protein [uncultured Rhodoblastus sp.]
MSPSYLNETLLAHRVTDFCKRIGISKATFWKYVKAGKIHVIRIGGRTLVPHTEAVRLSTEGTN